MISDLNFERYHISVVHALELGNYSRVSKETWGSTN